MSRWSRASGIAGARHGYACPMTRRLLQIMIGIFLGLFISGLILYPTIRDERARVQAEEMGFLTSPLPPPSFTLTAHTGERFTSDDLRGRVAFVFFGFSNCPDVCPVTLHNLTRALGEIPDGPERVQGVMITVDPERDTPERLRDFMRAYDPSFVALTGEEPRIRAAAESFGVFFRRADDVDPGDAAPVNPGGHEDHPAPTEGGSAADSGGYVVDHTARSYVLDPEGRIVLTFPPFATSEQMAAALRRLLARE